MNNILNKYGIYSGNIYDELVEQVDHVIEFDGGTSCNNPKKGYGEGYGSYKIDDNEIIRVKLGPNHSCNSAELFTIITALSTINDYDFKTILVCGDSQICMKWLLHPLSKIKNNAHSKTQEAIKILRKKQFNVLCYWRNRKKSVELFGH